MAHFARLDSNNNVINIIVVDNLKCFDFDAGCECEELGIAYCQDLYGADTRWVQTSYHGSIRGCQPGIGWTYDENTDTFLRSKPFESWSWNTSTNQWEAPIEMPTDICPEYGVPYVYEWNESIHSTDPTKGWQKVNPTPLDQEEPEDPEDLIIEEE